MDDEKAHGVGEAANAKIERPAAAEAQAADRELSDEQLDAVAGGMSKGGGHTDSTGHNILPRGK